VTGDAATPTLGSIVRYQGYVWEVIGTSERWTGAVSLGLWREGGETRSGVPAGDVELEGEQAPLFDTAQTAAVPAATGDEE
jgi:hypothetical protein